MRAALKLSILTFMALISAPLAVNTQQVANAQPSTDTQQGDTAAGARLRSSN